MSLSQLDCTHLQILDLREEEGKEQVNGGEVHVILFLSKTLVTYCEIGYCVVVCILRAM